MSGEVIYTDLDCVIQLFNNGDLPADEMAFKYYAMVGKIQWVHRDELKKLSILHSSYPTSSNKKGQKK